MSIAVFITSLLHSPLLPLTYTSDKWDSFPKVKNPLLGILFLTILPLESHDALFIVIFRTKKWKDEEENMEFLVLPIVHPVSKKWQELCFLVIQRMYYLSQYPEPIFFIHPGIHLPNFRTGRSPQNDSVAVLFWNHCPLSGEAVLCFMKLIPET